jgi:23S rRNA pseudouridine1911/1915/1917 synthase
MRVVVPDDLDGVRADRAVAVLFEVSRSVARRTIDAGAAVRRDAPLRPSDPVSAGDELVVSIVDTDDEVLAEPVDFRVAYEDDAVIVVDKPAGLVVHPGAGTRSGTLANGLLARFPSSVDLGPDRRWGIVHRLDRDTSGLLVVARTGTAQDALQDALRRREVTRKYLALVVGKVPSATGTIDAPIGRDPSNPTRMTVTAGGRPARTHYRRLATWDEHDLTLLSVRLETGRTHQIRVHLSAIDHPIVGDPVYGPPVPRPEFAGGVLEPDGPRPSSGDPGRTWLHAAELAFDHPSGSGAVTVRSPLPGDLVDSLDRLGPPSSGALPG